ncbi:maleylpyruvate isomerase N-terminal domain-containing protein [Streptomyces sp. NPDC057428]|uniref:maleylpyruvate isomerase N-terminal domain-containing protein n=1 Tax=Streptomyces sp. NPDC057428 TaxID=3346129 RepID=UPI00368024B0
MASDAAPDRMLDELSGYSDGPFAVVDAFVAQRARFLRYVSGLDDAAWRAATRCSEWNVHDVARHVRDVAALHVFQLGGPFPGFRLTREFDPVLTPAEWLRTSSGESPEETVRELTRLVQQEELLLRTKAAAGPDETILGALGRTLDWSVQSVHTFWDAWMHERDITLPRGEVPEYGADEMRLATMYGLLCAAAPPSWNGDYVHAGLLLEGGADASYVVTSVDGVIRVLAAPVDEAGRLTGGAGPTLDSLAGRGPELEDVLHGPSPALEQLALLRKIVT